jgi:hypothetical protein
VQLQLAEAARKRHMLGRRDVLLAKHQHLVRHQRLTQLARLLLAHGLAQVYARNLHAYGGEMRLSSIPVLLAAATLRWVWAGLSPQSIMMCLQSVATTVLGPDAAGLGQSRRALEIGIVQAD